jgi:hypothetical protein
MEQVAGPPAVEKKKKKETKADGGAEEVESVTPEIV